MKIEDEFRKDLSKKYVYFFVLAMFIGIGGIYIKKYETRLPAKISERQAEAVKETCLKLGLRMKIVNTEKENKAACYK